MVIMAENVIGDQQLEATVVISNDEGEKVETLVLKASPERPGKK